MPGYGVAGPEAGLLPWSWAEERLRGAWRYWVVTVSPDGEPHAMPVWAVWLDDALWFSTGGRSRKARNLRREPRCVVHTDGEDPVVVNGTASFVVRRGGGRADDRGVRGEVPRAPAGPGREPDRPRAAVDGHRAGRGRVRDEPDAVAVLNPGIEGGGVGRSAARSVDCACEVDTTLRAQSATPPSRS